jgi:beta-glucosidase-like glycosyl hydrolase
MLAGATTFPAASARGASWDPHLEERVGDVMGREARAHGANMIGGPCINLLRHPAWGRAQEAYGEDSYHLGEMGAALTRGIQRHVMSIVKHFALNSMENARFKIDVSADPRTLHEVYLPHFKRVVDEGVASVMSSYNSVNGEWAGQNKPLLTDILRNQWGFRGFVQSDWMFGMRDAKKAALAGQCVEMPLKNVFHRFLPDLVKRGEVPEELVNDAALRILRQQVRFAQGRDPRDYTADVIGCEAHRRLAREAAQKSIVLLKNEGRVLPLAGVHTSRSSAGSPTRPTRATAGPVRRNPPTWSHPCRAFARQGEHPSTSSPPMAATSSRPRRWPSSPTWRSASSATTSSMRASSSGRRCRARGRSTSRSRRPRTRPLPAPPRSSRRSGAGRLWRRPGLAGAAPRR